MEEYILDQLKSKDVVIKELQERVKRLERESKRAYELDKELKDAYEWEEELKDALEAVGRELVLVIQQDGDEYIKVRDDHWSTLHYERRDVLTLKPYIKNVRDERKKKEEEEK